MKHRRQYETYKTIKENNGICKARALQCNAKARWDETDSAAQHQRR